MVAALGEVDDLLAARSAHQAGLADPLVGLQEFDEKPFVMNSLIIVTKR